MIISTLLLVCLGITFFLSVVLTSWWITRARKAGLVGIDMHKRDRSNVAEIGGLPVLIAFLIGVFLYLGIRTFLFSLTSFNTEILAAVLTVVLVAIIGLIDDILGWKIGLRQWQKPLLCLFAALPIMMINAGTSTMDIPLFGVVDFGILFPLVIIPIIISASSNAFNMIAGYNGLEAGLGIIMLFAIGFIVWQVQGLGIYAMLAAIMIASLIGFFIFNSRPAKIFPGDTLTYAVGALIAIIAILGNAEKVLLILFIPYFIQFFIKSFHGWQKQSFSQINEDESIIKPNKINALEHIPVLVISFFKKRVGENGVVYLLYLFEILFVLIALGFVL